MKLLRLLSSSILCLLCLAPTFCSAHPGHSESFDLLTGMAHPFSGIDHFLVILLVGFWSVLSFKKPWLGPLSFVLGMIAGSTAGLFTATAQYLEVAIALSVIITGFVLVSKSKFSENLSSVLLIIFGVFHGLAHTGYLPVITSFNVGNISMDLLGLVLGTLFLHMTGLYIAKLTIQSNPLITKIAGIATTLYGSFLLIQLSL